MREDIYRFCTLFGCSSQSRRKALKILTTPRKDPETRKSASSTQNLQQIRMGALKWMQKDTDYTDEHFYHFVDKISKMADPRGIDNLHVLREHFNLRKIALMDMWNRNTHDIKKVRLDHLFLDTTEAFAPDGEYQGVEAAKVVSAISCALAETCEGSGAERGLGQGDH